MSNDKIFLSSTVTIAEYKEMKANKDKKAIAEFIKERFTERYIRPLRIGSKKKHGFCTMAICCLMIETLESFWQGWRNTRGKSREAFISFFKRCQKDGLELGIFAPVAECFYKGVRCGILHQGETTHGWLILRRGPLLNCCTKIINATKFHNELENALRHYIKTLKESDWEDEIWRNLRKKMDAIIDNCYTKCT